MILWNNSPVRGILFDMDGVIADTREAHTEAWGRFARTEGMDWDMDEFMRLSFGRGNNQVLQLFYRHDAPDYELYAQKSQEKEELYLEILRAGAVKPVPGLFDALEAFASRGIRMAVGSSAPRRNIDETLATFGITHHFPVIVSMHDVVHAKPDPEIFLLAAQRVGQPPADCVVLEDSVHGLEAARAAGSRSIGITTMHAPHEIADLCDATAADFVEVLKVLQNG